MNVENIEAASSNPSPVPPNLPSKWLKILTTHRSKLCALAVVIVAAIWIDPLNWFHEKVRPDVALLWNAGIASLGIEPLYPMAEDVRIGDVYVRVSDQGLTEEQKNEENIKAVLYRGIRIARLRLNPETQEQPRYEETIMCSSKLNAENDCPLINHIENPNDSSNSLASPDPTIIGFPTIKLSVTGSALVDALPAGLAALGGAKSETLNIAIPEAYTFGASQGNTVLTLLKYCRNEETKNYCSPSVNRMLLAAAFHGPIERPVAKSAAKSCFLQLEISIITRTYFTRELIVNRRLSDTRFLGRLFEVSQILDSTESGKSTNSNEGGKTPISANSLTENIVGSSVRFRRPVVFGYRSATFLLDSNLFQGMDAKNQFPPCVNQ